MKQDIKEHLRSKATGEKQVTLFEQNTDLVLEEIKNAIASMDVNNLTPIDAINLLNEIKEEI